MTSDYNHMMEHNYRRQQFEEAVEKDRLITQHRQPRKPRLNPAQWIVRLVNLTSQRRIRIAKSPQRSGEQARNLS